MDFYGDDRKLSELGNHGFSDFLLEKDEFPSPDSALNGPVLQDEYGMSGMDWLDTFFEDPVLNDRMISEAVCQPAAASGAVQFEHSYSAGDQTKDLLTASTIIKTEPKDKDSEDMIPTHTTSPLNLTMPVSNPETEAAVKAILAPEPKPSPNTGITQNMVSLVTMASLQAAQSHHIQTVVSPGPGMTVLKQPTIILATTTPSQLGTAATLTYQDRLVLPKLEVKLEPGCSSESASRSISPEYSPYIEYDSATLPPSPPSSNSDSDGSQSPQWSAPSSPVRHTQILRQHRIQQLTHHSNLFSSHIPTSGILMLSEEEKRTLVQEGYPVPQKLPLSKQEEKNLKKIRRKIKNKISAQESRRKKKEYLETLEKRVEAFSQENNDLHRKMNHLETNNRSLMSQLHRLQSLVNKLRPTAQSAVTPAGTGLMVLVLCFAMFLGAWSPSSMLTSSSSPSVLPITTQLTIDMNITPMEHVNSNNMGPLHKSPSTEPDYITPNLRSRVLMSVIDEEEDDFGPETPSCFAKIFTSWFQTKQDQSDIQKPEIPLVGMPLSLENAVPSHMDPGVSMMGESQPNPASIVTPLTISMVEVMPSHARRNNNTA